MIRWMGNCLLLAALFWSQTGAAAPSKNVGPRASSTSSSAKPSAAAKAGDLAKAKAHKLETHRVYTGQTLGMIAKRYNVTIAALCTANGIDRRDPIRPGQMLVVPKRSDKDGSQARDIYFGLTPKQPAAPTKTTAPTAVAKSAPQKPAAAAKIITATTAAKAPTAAATQKGLLASKAAPSKKLGWQQYRKPAPKKGYVVLNATGRSWKGFGMVKGNRLSSHAQTGFNRALYSWRTGREAQISPQLIRLLIQVSDTFGGRPLKVASGYREHSHAKDSRHKLGLACDFTVIGVPNEALRDYLLTLNGVGVGYYPNSSFVHLDVRKTKTYWIDYSGPGQAPRYSHQRNKGRTAPLTKPAPEPAGGGVRSLAPGSNPPAPNPALLTGGSVPIASKGDFDELKVPFESEAPTRAAAPVAARDSELIFTHTSPVADELPTPPTKARSSETSSASGSTPRSDAARTSTSVSASGASRAPDSTAPGSR
jgi:uncharacterized protein YcbK (DUF882 family)